MSAGQRGLLAFWMGGASATASVTTAGLRSQLAPWIGGASAPADVGAQAGNRSLLAHWIGGASAPAPTGTQAGYRGLLGFWIGGTAAGEDEVVTPPVEEERYAGGWFDRLDRRPQPDKQKRPKRSDRSSVDAEPVSFSIGDRAGANELRKMLLLSSGLTESGRNVLEAASEDELPLILAMFMAMDD